MPITSKLDTATLRSVNIPLNTTSGWTVTSASGTGAGSINTTTQRARVVVTSGTLGWAENTRSISLDLPTVDGSAVEMTARLATFTNADANSRAQFVIQYPITGVVFGLTIYGDGTFEKGYLSSASVYTAGSTTNPAMFPTNGTGWAKLRVRGSLYEGFYGTGTTTTPPTQWIETGSTNVSFATDGDLVPNEFTAGGGQVTAGPAGNLVIEWANISIKHLS